MVDALQVLVAEAHQQLALASSKDQDGVTPRVVVVRQWGGLQLSRCKRCKQRLLHPPYPILPPLRSIYT